VNQTYLFLAFLCVGLPLMLGLAVATRFTQSVAVRRTAVIVGVLALLALVGVLVPSAIEHPFNWVLVALTVGGIVFVLHAEFRRR
jgi:hypothetical protein